MRRVTAVAAFSVLCLLLTKMAAAEDAAAAPPVATITVDTAKTGQPISKYVYGQFIEHLGRCIHGGIWAEMLEDRKFFHPVGAPRSPWKALGDNQAVTMARENPYAGQHTPRITLGADARGIGQDRLALQEGRKYEGRIVLMASGAAKVEVSLVWGAGAEERQSVTIEKISAEYTKTPLSFTARGDTADGRLEIAGRGEGSLRVGAVSLMPADNVEGMRADTLKLLRELDAPIYRWPGGNFVSGYQWRDGIGERDRRPPRWDFAWNALEANDFGLDEFMVFCRLLKTEPLVVVNSGFGDEHSAAREVEYANGGSDTRMGRWRAANGHGEPYRVRWWGIGNEMYGDWQLGFMQLNHYVVKHNLFAQAMRQVDPSIQLIAVGDAGPWSEGMLNGCAEEMDLIAEHFYQGAKDDLTAHVRQISSAVAAKAKAHREYRNRLDTLKGKDIRIALDEWNYSYAKYPFGRGGRRFFLRDALGVAAGLHEMFRQSDLFFMANYAQTVNVLGAIRTTKTHAAFDPPGLPLALYRKHFGVLPVAVGGVPEPLDVAAAWTADRKALTIGVVNPTQQPRELALEVEGAQLAGNGRLWQITAPDAMAFNEPGQVPQVAVEEKPLTQLGNRVSVAPLSITLFELRVR